MFAQFAASSLKAGENGARIKHPLAAHCQYYSNQAAWKTLGSEKPRLASIAWTADNAMRRGSTCKDITADSFWICSSVPSLR